MAISIITICGLILGTAQWRVLEQRAFTVFPVLQDKYFHRGDTFDETELAAARKLEAEFGLLKEWSIPMYYRHLLTHPKSDEFRSILILVEKIGIHQTIFVPFALQRIEDRAARNSALWYIHKYGARKDAAIVAGLLSKPAFRDEDPRVLFECLKEIGGKDELRVLDQFANDNIARKRKEQYAAETAACRKAIEARLEAEAKTAADDRPTWFPIGNSRTPGDFIFYVEVRPDLPTKKEHWRGEGWSEIRALIEPNQNGESDREPKLALRHGFQGELGRFGGKADATPAVQKFPSRVVFPPTFLSGKEYYLPIHSHLFRAYEPVDGHAYFNWIPDAKTPKGIPALKRDSLCIPQVLSQYTAYLQFKSREERPEGRPGTDRHTHLSVMSATRQEGGDKLWEAQIECQSLELSERGLPWMKGSVKVREGNILIVPDFGGFVVRHIVPHDAKTLAIGWVELDGHIIESDTDVVIKAKKEGREIVRFNMKGVKAK